jgi:transposase
MRFTETEKFRVAVVALFNEKYSFREIARKLHREASTVIKIIKNYKLNKSTERKKGSGGKFKLDQEDTKFVKKSIIKNKELSASKIAAALYNATGKNVSQWTISRFLRKEGFLSRKYTNRPELSSKNIKSRLIMTNNWSKWPLKKFRKIIFSDECRFCLNGSDGRQRIRRKSGECLNPENIKGTKKFGGGGVMAWGCISYNGVGKLVVIEGNLDSIKYRRLLSENLHDSAEIMNLDNDFIFQQDNAGCHVSKYTMEFFNENGINLLEWPAQSLDLNPIEHIWSFMKKKLLNQVLKNKGELINKLNEIWNSLPRELVKNLIDSMPRRCEAVIRANGGHTRY